MRRYSEAIRQNVCLLYDNKHWTTHKEVTVRDNYSACSNVYEDNCLSTGMKMVTNAQWVCAVIVFLLCILIAIVP